MNIRILIALAASISIGACNGNSAKSTDDKATGLAAISGVWDVSRELETSMPDEYAINEGYEVITNDGKYYKFSYQGDEYTTLTGAAKNCYKIISAGTITYLQDDTFYLDFETPYFWESLDAEIIISRMSNYEIKIVDGMLKMYAIDLLAISGIFEEGNVIKILSPEEIEEAIENIKLLSSAPNGITLETMQSMQCETDEK